MQQPIIAIMSVVVDGCCWLIQNLIEKKPFFDSLPKYKEQKKRIFPLLLPFHWQHCVFVLFILSDAKMSWERFASYDNYLA
jgi:hypothetical protein